MAQLIARTGNELTIEVKVNIDGSLLQAEDAIQNACNEVGLLATEKALKNFDTDGTPLQTGDIKWTAKPPSEKKYQTPYGVVEVERYTYQTSKGGKVWCPLEEQARIIRGGTPRLAKQVSHKYVHMNAQAVCHDFEANHNRKLTKSYIQNMADWVGGIAQAKEQDWTYTLPALDEAVSTIVFSMDGAYILMQEDGWREAMVGALSFYDTEGKRLHSLYLGAPPEYGKETFKQRYEKEIQRIKALYPDALYLGIADGAKDNWSFLTPHTHRQLLDFYHVTEYLGKVAYAAFPQKTGKPKRTQWLSNRCHQLKHEPEAVKKIIEEMETLTRKKGLTKTVKEDLTQALTYFNNHQHQMNYAEHIAAQLPIGSGVTEAACKTLVKQRLCCSGMRWKNQGAGIILSLRALVQSGDRWEQFWNKINQYGAQCYT
jgi:hypothetical protein